MKSLFKQLALNPDRARLVLMPISRMVVESPLSVGRFRVLPPGEVDIADLRPVTHHDLSSFLDVAASRGLSGQSHREFMTALTGFNVESLASSPLIAFTAEVDWSTFLNATHEDDIQTLRQMSATAERALDVVRLHLCQLNLPDTLPGVVGSWDGSGQHLGALIYTLEDHESYLIAGPAVECSAVVKGLGLQMDMDLPHELPAASDGEVAAIAVHGLSLLSDAMHAPNDTIKFVRVMTLFEFLASPDEFQNWKKLKGDIACHCVNNKQNYLRLCERFKQLTSTEDQSGVQRGFRTLIVHHGKFIEEILPGRTDRKALFQELQDYCMAVLFDMLDKKTFSWSEFTEHRTSLKKALGVVSVTE